MLLLNKSKTLPEPARICFIIHMTWMTRVYLVLTGYVFTIYCHVFTRKLPVLWFTSLCRSLQVKSIFFATDIYFSMCLCQCVALWQLLLYYTNYRMSILFLKKCKNFCITVAFFIRSLFISFFSKLFLFFFIFLFIMKNKKK